MKTRLTSSPLVAAAILRAGETVAFPTETVYGLGADALNRAAVAKIFRAKGRPADNPLIVHVAHRRLIDLLALSVPPAGRKLIAAFFPGPLTVILRRSRNVPSNVTAGLGTVGIRMPDEKLTRMFLRACGTPVAAPSANRSGSPSPTTWQAVRDDLDGRIGCILRGKRALHGVESTVVDCTVTPPAMLRSGAITLEELRKIVPSVRGSLAYGRYAPKSPGMKYRHYAPRARVVIVDTPPENVRRESAAYIGLTRSRATFAARKICPSLSAYAHELYHFFRACDRNRIRTIYCQKTEKKGLGRTIMERLEKASQPGTRRSSS